MAETEVIRPYPIWFKVLAFIVFTLGYLAIGLSRMILGMHSIN